MALLAGPGLNGSVNAARVGERAVKCEQAGYQKPGDTGSHLPISKGILVQHRLRYLVSLVPDPAISNLLGLRGLLK
ncbi:MAG: hypothetical protein M1493_04070 [Firmicutes bacterium]|uniref:Uncharacterized protein n=1 Tax=Sulfobacillus benefaciens TaxID=453960 RepID=A0A2T2X9H7_9FIRM|nr:hypothetical protein [Bacillota bacterium]PSR31140.1 MAG: hypothetical protein C7B43_03320 [Sulfobacillus benefaciens]